MPTQPAVWRRKMKWLHPTLVLEGLVGSLFSFPSLQSQQQVLTKCCHLPLRGDLCPGSEEGWGWAVLASCLTPAPPMAFWAFTSVWKVFSLSKWCLEIQEASIWFKSFSEFLFFEKNLTFTYLLGGIVGVRGQLVGAFLSLCHLGLGVELRASDLMASTFVLFCLSTNTGTRHILIELRGLDEKTETRRPLREWATLSQGLWFRFRTTDLEPLLCVSCDEAWATQWQWGQRVRAEGEALALWEDWWAWGALES